jgi:HD-GYP domain-containing protein (c-di-GMP phosphodiesterase class II)
VADAYDAMTSDRSYRRALPPEAALAELDRHAGAQFDPACVAALRTVLARDADARVVVAG